MSKPENTAPGRQPHGADPAWLGLVQEEIIDPAQPLIDPHHHLMQRGSVKYFFEDYLADVQTGHNVRASVYIECGSMWRKKGPPMMAPLGEVEFANGVAAMSASGGYGEAQICAGIVGSADFVFGDRIAALLDAQLAAAPDRFRGIRISATWDADSRLQTGRIVSPKGLLADPVFRAAFACLAPRQLSFEAWVFHPQLDEVADLAKAFPETTIIVNHVGGLLSRWETYADHGEEALAQWRASLGRLAECPNVTMKLGGLGMPFMGFSFAGAASPPTSMQLESAWGPTMHACIDAFGPSRCMFETNFPPDKQSCSYPVLWNGFKRIAARYTAQERQDLLHDTALRAYRLDHAV